MSRSINYYLQICRVPVFSLFCQSGTWWFRIFGKGISAKDVTKHPLMFSERNGYLRYIKLGKWIIKVI